MSSNLMINLDECIQNAICSVLDIPLSSFSHHATFTSLGGDSLAAIAVSNRCKRNDIFIPVSAILCGNTISTIISAAKRHSLKDSPSTHGNLTDMIQKCTICEESNYENKTGPAEDIQQDISMRRLTEMQQILINGSRLRPGTNIISFRETYKAQDVDRMKKGWEVAIRAESILYSGNYSTSQYRSLNNNKDEYLAWTEEFSTTEKEYLEKINDILVVSDFDVSLKVITLLRADPTQSISTIIWRVHHALIDGWSARIVYRNARRAAEGLPIQANGSFERAACQLEALAQASDKYLRDFWRRETIQSREFCGNIAFGTSETHPPKEYSFEAPKSAIVNLNLDLDMISDWCRNHDVTKTALYSGAWAMVLSCYTDSDSVVFGVVVSGRGVSIDAAEEVVGPLINTLPLHVRLDKDHNSLDLLRSILSRTVLLETVAHSKPIHGFQRNFCSAISRDIEFVSTECSSILPVGHNSFEVLCDIPIAIAVQPTGDIRITYHTDRYSERQIGDLLGHYRNVIYALLDASTSIGSCMQTIISGQSLRHLLELGNSYNLNTSTLSEAEDLVTLFENIVRSRSSSVAIEKGKDFLTYGQLDRHANLIASALYKLIRPGDYVFVHADRSINWIISIYGILKAGGVYVPLDPSLPAEVRRNNVLIAGGDLMLIPQTEDISVGSGVCNRCFSVESMLNEAIVSPQSWQHRKLPRPFADAYICFTSGSAGAPKAVLCSNEGLVAFQRDENVRLRANPGVRVCQVMSPAFDGSIHEIFSSLSYGATLVLPSPELPLDHLKHVDSAILIPSIAAVLDPEEFPRLLNVYFVGEPVPEYLKNLWSASKNLFNMYGPTEGTCGSTIKRLVPSDPVSIGKPNPSTRLYILNRYRELLPHGVEGEIYLAGLQVARRYVGSHERTVERFLPDTIGPRAGDRMYRTGDYGFWTEQGELIYSGRKDRQIKLRGFRLDLTDLEVRIREAVPEATKVAVVVYKRIYEEGDGCLGAMLQCQIAVDVKEVNNLIKQALPTYARPRRIIVCREMPLTLVGKLDYKTITNKLALSDVDSVNIGTKCPEGNMRTTMEKIVELNWRKILQLQPEQLIDHKTSFSTLGADSLQYLILCDALSCEFGTRIPLKLVWAANSLGSLASALEECVSISSFPPHTSKNHTSSSKLGLHNLSPIEKEWWQQYQNAKGDSGVASFNVSMLWKLDPCVDCYRLAEAWDYVLSRHRILASRFINDANGPRRILGLSPKVCRLYIKNTTLNVQKFLNKPFEFTNSKLPVVRVAISSSILAISISHILADMITLNVLLDEVRALYAGKTLGPVESEYKDTIWSMSLDKPLLDFWLSNLKPVMEFRSKRKQVLRKSLRGCSRMFQLSQKVSSQICAFSCAEGFTLHQLALGAVSLALCDTIVGHDGPIILGMPYFNRSSTNLRTVGLFLEPMPIVISPRGKDYRDNNSNQPFLEHVRAASRAAIEHAIPWHMLRATFTDNNDISAQSAWVGEVVDAMVTVHNNTDNEGDALGIQGCSPMVCWSTGSKFPLMCEFSVISKESILLRLEWDNELFDSEKINGFINKLMKTLVSYSAGMELTSEPEENGFKQEVRCETLIQDLR